MSKYATVPDEFAEQTASLYEEALDLLLRKHDAYGPKNIANSPGGALNGLRVRMHDKQARLNHLVDHGNTEQVGESLEDTLLDLANYALIGVLVLRGLWPSE